MNEERAKPEDRQAEQGAPADTRTCCEPGGPDASPGGPMQEMMKDCPCGSFVKDHRLAVFAIMAVLLLAFLISQVGGILGIIAFVRTL